MKKPFLSKAKDLIQKSIVCDGQLGFEPSMPTPFIEKWKLVDRYAKSGFNLVTLSLANDESTFEQSLRYLGAVLAHIERHEKHYVVAKTVKDIIQAKKEKKLAIHLMFQGTHPIQQDLDLLSLYYQLGIRSMVAAYNIKTSIGDGCIEVHDGGLSHLGKRWVNEMNRVGMLIDCSHTGYQTSMDILTTSQSPVIFSHANMDGLFPHPRNLKDEQVKAVEKTGGVIGINGLGVLLGGEDASVKKLLEHIQYVIDLVGPKTVSLGLDYLYFASRFEEFMQNQPVTHPQIYASRVKKAFAWKSIEPEHLFEIVEALLKRGYSEKEVRGILGENYLRVAQRVWR